MRPADDFFTTGCVFTPPDCSGVLLQPSIWRESDWQWLTRKASADLSIFPGFQDNHLVSLLMKAGTFILVNRPADPMMNIVAGGPCAIFPYRFFL